MNELVIAAALLLPNPFGNEVIAAAKDAAKLPPEVAATTRYISYWWVDEKLRPEHVQINNLWINSLSRASALKPMRKVTETLYAVDLYQYRINPKIWEGFKNFDPYFHVQLKKVAPWPGGIWPKDGKHYESNAFLHETKTAAAAPWLPTKEIGTLVALTQSESPLLRADWWFNQTSIQDQRDGVGYYDFLGVKNRDDFDKLVALDIKASQKIEREFRAIVSRSGVSRFGRQLERLQGLTGGYWRTLDVLDDNKNERNALRNLDADYKHQAEEIYAPLSNGLFAYFLCDQNGVRQDSAPDKIGYDKTASLNDGRIHIGLSCVRCHVEGLRPINDWGRQIFTKGINLASPDREKAKRLEQLYLSNLDKWYKADNDAYAAALKECCNMTPEESAKAIGRVWKAYDERDLLPADAAREFGLTEEVYLERLRAYFTADKLADLVLASHIADPPIAIRQDDFEQLMPLVAPIALQKGK